MEATTAFNINEDLEPNTDSLNVEEVQDLPTQNEYNCNSFIMISSGLLIIIVFLFGVIGNILSIITFKTRANENAMSLMLMSLALVDTGVLITFCFMISVPAFCDYFQACSHYLNYAYMVLTAYFWPIPSFLHLSSTWHITLVTFHRYLGVCHPHKFMKWNSIRQTRIQILVINIVSFLYNIPRFLDDVSVMKESGGGLTIRKTSLGSNKIYGYVYEIGLYYLVIYAIPFASLTYMTICLVKALKVSKKKKQAMTQSKKDEDDLTLTLVVVVVVYMVCQIMNPIRRGMLLTLPRSSRFCGSVHSFVTFFAQFGILFNSAANFFIYCLFGKHFRNHLMEKLSCIKWNRIGVAGPDTSSLPHDTGNKMKAQNVNNHQIFI